MTEPLEPFKIGHVYSIDYDDRWGSDSSYRGDEDGTPCQLRQRGVCILETEKTVVIEHNVHLSDRNPSNPRTDRHGIIKSCIVKVRHYGEEGA